MNQPAPPPLGRHLVDARLLDEDQLRIALIEQATKHRRLGELLVELGFVSERRLVDALATHLNTTPFPLHDITCPAEAIALIPGELARQHHILPVAHEPTTGLLRLAMTDPHDQATLDHLRTRLPEGIRIDPVLAGRAEIELAIDRHYGQPLAIDALLGRLEKSGSEDGNSGGSPAVALIDHLLRDAVSQGASDIHFEPETTSLRIRYRIDGLLERVRTLHKRSWAFLGGRLKVLAGMNIAESRTPQDGHFSQLIGGRPVDFRVASQPTIHGEAIVLRILDRQKGIVPLDGLGLAASEQALLERLLARPAGLLLVAGPTGSGKTTTLYSMLARLDSERLNIMTLEDPVEYPLPNLRQTSLAEGLKLDFASGIRSLLRQDPDVILIGEIRDAETAGMAVRAALTGHQVFATLHATSALNALARLRELGIDSDRLHGNLTGIVAQRLVRRLCPHCRRPRPAAPAESAVLGRPTLWEAAGCEHCRQTGYRGRLALVEIVRIDPTLDLLLGNRAPASQLHAAATAGGQLSLATCGLNRVASGDTTLSELARAVDLSEILP